LANVLPARWERTLARSLMCCATQAASVLDMANNYGGWAKVQTLLAAVSRIARKHGVAMQTVALRWQIDAGTFPAASVRWGDGAWAQFGHRFHRGPAPGIDAQLFQVRWCRTMAGLRSGHQAGRYQAPGVI
jgi:hypothetical protein